jgi:hypothetical protein
VDEPHISEPLTLAARNRLRDTVAGLPHDAVAFLAELVPVELRRRAGGMVARAAEARPEPPRRARKAER